MAVDMFLKISGIDGESSDKQHKGTIEVLSFSWGVSNPARRAGTSKLASGRTNVSDFSIRGSTCTRRRSPSARPARSSRTT